MPKGKVLTPDVLDTVLMLKSKGVSSADVAKILGISDSTVCDTVMIYDAIKDGKRLPSHSNGKMNTIQWACAKLGKDVASVYSKESPAPSKDNSDGKKRNDGEVEAAAKVDNTALAFASLLEALKQLTAAVENIDRRMSAMQMTQQGMRGELGEHTKKIIEAIHIEGDIISKENERAIDLLGGIKMNTKKKQFREVEA